VAGPKETLRYLRFCAYLYVYSCALPPVVVAAILKALEIGMREPELRTKLWENADYFHAQLRNVGIDTGGSTTYIMPLVIGDRERMYRLGHQLRARGLFVAPVDYPAVPEEGICFRACVTANHTRADLDEALNIISDTLVPELLPKRCSRQEPLRSRWAGWPRKIRRRRAASKAPTKHETSRVSSTSTFIVASATNSRAFLPCSGVRRAWSPSSVLPSA